MSTTDISVDFQFHSPNIDYVVNWVIDHLDKFINDYHNFFLYHFWYKILEECQIIDSNKIQFNQMSICQELRDNLVAIQNWCRKYPEEVKNIITKAPQISMYRKHSTGLVFLLEVNSSIMSFLEILFDEDCLRYDAKKLAENEIDLYLTTKSAVKKK